jgi:hypothetical protein
MNRLFLPAVLAAAAFLSGCGKASRQIEEHKKQIVGTWYTTNRTGRVLAFTADGRVLMFATATRGTFFENSTYAEGGVGYDIVPEGSEVVLRFSKRDPAVSGDAGEEFQLVSLDGDSMVLQRKGKNSAGRQTTLKRLDPVPLDGSAVLERLPDDGYLRVPTGATSTNVDDF